MLTVVGAVSALQMQIFLMTVFATARIHLPNRQEKRVSFQNRIKITPQARYNICARNIEVTRVAQFLDKLLPNRILVPANKLTKKVNLSLKNKTFRQIIISSGLTLKS